jgi:hypothetical protein
MIVRYNRLTILVIILVCLCANTLFAVGEAAVITLVFPYGARSNAMGEVGVALADDESAMFWNPAGLGIRNQERWRGGAESHFWEPVLPAFGLKDLWHFALAGCYQRSTESEYGLPISNIYGFGAYINHLNLGVNEWSDELGRRLGRAHSYESIYNLSFGTNIFPHAWGTHAVGLSVKYIYSALAPGYEGNKGVGRSFCLDAGYLYVFPFHLRLGFTAANMGQSIYYITREESDPLPFTLRMGIAYKNQWSFGGLCIASLAAEFDANRELVNHEIGQQPDPFFKAMYTDFGHPEEIVYNHGFEVQFLRTVAVRCGQLYDDVGSRNEYHQGFGLSWCNHFTFDLYFIHSPKGSIARDRQWGFSFTMFNLGFWRPQDVTWWRVVPKNTSRDDGTSL